MIKRKTRRSILNNKGLFFIFYPSLFGNKYVESKLRDNLALLENKTRIRIYSLRGP